MTAFLRIISSLDVQMAVGVQAIMDLVFKSSLVTAQQSPPSARPSDFHLWLQSVTASLWSHHLPALIWWL
jgi:hypothetical protein